MQAVILPLGRPLAPFGDAPGASRVLDHPLRDVQRQALADAGVELVDAPPPDQPWLAVSDRTWFTPEVIRRLRSTTGDAPGRLHVDDADFLATTGPLQELDAPGLFELAILPPGAAGLDAAPPVTVDLGLESGDLPALHPRMQHAARPLRVGAAMVHQVDHWSHLVRVNHLALAGRALEEKLRWDASPWWRKLGRALGVLWKAKSLQGSRIARALCEVGKDVDIHPTAVVELCQLGDGVRIGPNAVVRASILGPGAVVDEFASVNLSVVGEGAHIGRYAMVNLCTLYPGAWASWANAYQACIIGRDAFVAWGATLLDMSFGKTIKVERHNADGSTERVDSEQHFLGVAIGHRAVIGHAVKVNYGVGVPNDAVLVAGTEGLLRSWGDAPVGEACRVDDGRAQALKRR